MTIAPLDGLIVALYLIAVFVLAIAARRRAGKDLEEYFLAGRGLGWFAAGCSMAAATFALDTPLAVAGMVSTKGIAGNWIWWSMAPGCLVAAFLFAPMWRRVGILTDIELVEVRYEGPPAELLRAVRAFIDGFIRPAIIISLLSILAGQVVYSMMGVDPIVGVVFFLFLTALYTAVSGFRGVVLTGLLQLGLAILGTTLFALYASHSLGGDLGLMDRVAEAIEGAARKSVGVAGPSGGVDIRDLRAFFPFGSALMPLSTILILLSLAWWTTGAADGGGFFAQRAFAARDRGNARWAYLWWGVIHFCLRPWAWIVVGLVLLARNPMLWLHGIPIDMELDSIETAHALLPAGLRGLVLVAFLAAFMSTVSAQLNWSAAYLVNDFWRRFLAPKQSAKQYVHMARFATMMVLVVAFVFLAAFATILYNVSIFRVWEFMLPVGAGIGGVMILRWYWWRVNAWSEFAAILGAPVFTLALTIIQREAGPFAALGFPYSVVWVTVLTTAAWLAVMRLTKPEPEVQLLRFYMRCRPGGPGWKHLAFRIPGFREDGPGRREVVGILLGVAVLYGGTFGIGNILLGSAAWGWVLLFASVVGGGILWRNWRPV